MQPTSYNKRKLQKLYQERKMEIVSVFREKKRKFKKLVSEFCQCTNKLIQPPFSDSSPLFIKNVLQLQK